MAKSPPASREPSIADAIRASVPATPTRSVCWYQQIPLEILAELEVVRSEWRAKKLPGSQSAMAKAIVGELHRRKLHDVGIQGVTAWLRKN